MNHFVLRLLDASRAQDIPAVTSFVGEDSSGSFGIQASHDRFITVLTIGLARFRTGDGNWQYLAMPGGTVYFRDNLLTITTRHYLMDDNYQRISGALEQQLLAEEQKLAKLKDSVHHMESAVFRRLWELRRPTMEPTTLWQDTMS